MLRTCKECGHTGLYLAKAQSLKLKGFHGHVCYACYLEEQRVWRGTAAGREYANEASRKTVLRKRTQRNAPRDT